MKVDTEDDEEMIAVIQAQTDVVLSSVLSKLDADNDSTAAPSEQPRSFDDSDESDGREPRRRRSVQVLLRPWF